ncbi:MAG: cytochrome c [Bryobacterales bacterium]|nr:cytochrome c [Bryobacterales bacterium]
MRRSRLQFALHSLALAALLGPLCGCVQKMNVQPKYPPYASSDFFADGGSARPQVDGTVDRESPLPVSGFDSGKMEGGWADGYPFPITAARMHSGRKNYNIFCSPCHGYTGDGNGIVVQRGLRGPVSFHEPRFLRYPTGYFFEVITNGRDAMFPYGSRIPVERRWEIIAYLRALQLSRNETLGAVPESERDLLVQEVPR